MTSIHPMALPRAIFALPVKDALDLHFPHKPTQPPIFSSSVRLQRKPLLIILLFIRLSNSIFRAYAVSPPTVSLVADHASTSPSTISPRFALSPPPPILEILDMNAFKAFKANVPIAWSPNLYITLVRGMPGTRRLHRRTLEALRLRKCNRTVMRWNTPTVRGMLQQVKRLIVVETEEMYKARKQKVEQHKALRPPLVVNHLPAPKSAPAS
ncbi:unnamed protein product [Citrullus colocynthis]|uniref:Large ribosomal subunit protein uL30m n=1 Tax=Citrullus colocynthis TaxID=252529 RepID=A0ABP0Y742_9ROSI